MEELLELRKGSLGGGDFGKGPLLFGVVRVVNQYFGIGMILHLTV
jgi:hypothetical protein